MNFAAFFSYVILTAITPGPNNILLLSSTSTFGFHPGRIVAFALVMALLLVWCAWKIVKT